MTAYNSLIIIVIGILMMALGSLAQAANDVTIVSAPSKTSTTKKSTADTDKPSSTSSSRRKKTPTKSSAAAKSTETKKPDRAPAIVSSPAPANPTPSASSKAASTARPASTPVAKAKASEDEPAASAPKIPPAAASAVAVTTALAGSSGSPAVETGLPVARRSAIDPGPTATNPSSTIQSTPPNPKSTVSPYPGVNTPAPSTVAMSGYRNTAPPPTEDFVFPELGSKRKNVYPWKTNIWTTKFWIGEGGSTISPTANIDSAWVRDWRGENGGTDTPTYRNGYSTGSHAARTNPFYVALPFNDLVYPEKARRYLPPSWYRKPKNGKAVSWCKDRWVQIKNRQGRSCYAQWEDVGPLRTDHAEYVFGNERPTREYSQAGLDISPAVAQYLGIESGDFTSWRFVDEEDVRPGEWLKYDELAIIYKAMHEMKNSATPDRRRNDDDDDDANDDSNKKRVGAAKG